MSLYDHSNYRGYLREYLEKQPKKGHGLLSQWAKELRVSTALLSQIMKGEKLLSLEIADGLARVLGFSRKETEYFFLLVELERAGTASLKEHFKRKIQEEQEASRLLKNRIADVEELSTDVKAQYYSSWTYSGVRNLVACKNMKSLEDISERVKIPREKIAEIVEFLVGHQLLTPDFEAGPLSTYLPSDSPLIKKHHQNWRLKGMQKMDESLDEDLFYTSPMSLSKEVARKMRRHLVDVIEDVHRQTDPSPSETVRCLNIDWFEY